MRASDRDFVIYNHQYERCLFLIIYLNYLNYDKVAMVLACVYLQTHVV